MATFDKETKMADDISISVLEVPVAGYCWLSGQPATKSSGKGLMEAAHPDSDHGAGVFLAPSADSATRLREVRYYDPYQIDPPLFRLFAALQVTQDAILKFANQFGELGSSADFCLASKHPAQAKIPLRGEPLAKWKTEIAV